MISALAFNQCREYLRSPCDEKKIVGTLVISFCNMKKKAQYQQLMSSNNIECDLSRKITFPAIAVVHSIDLWKLRAVHQFAANSPYVKVFVESRSLKRTQVLILLRI